MERYDYEKAVRDDISGWLKEEAEFLGKYRSKEDALNDLEYRMMGSDSVTGNASGSYTFNSWIAEEYLCHNMDLFIESCEWYDDINMLRSAETCDVQIRCYMLQRVLDSVLSDGWYDRLVEAGK